MGREVRRVPVGWEHPKDERGNYIPLFDRVYREEADRWVTECIAWHTGEHEDLIDEPGLRDRYPYFWEWYGGPPDPDSYRPEWEEEPTGYQVYEDVSEGTPVTPVFETEAEMVEYLVDVGYTRGAAEAFVRDGWAVSFVMFSGADGERYLADGIEFAGVR